uniref:Transposase Helix-turn-helix domain-containing protein n=1 Tax=Daphnia galeata TaxID=27404 RepID=A0A8J2R9W5_9CRUS|nr:unnamed protein product [Daphnia galeata]
MDVEYEDMNNSSNKISQAENQNLKEEIERVNKELESAKVMISELEVQHKTLSLKLNEQIEGKPKKSLLSELEKSEQMTLFYTGLNSFELFLGIFNSLLPALVDDKRFKISLQEQFLMTLMKLRFNLSTTDLGYRFFVKKNLEKRGALLAMPAFKGTRLQLEGDEYTILRGPIKIRDLFTDPHDETFIDKVVTVCCCLLNAMTSVVPPT